MTLAEAISIASSIGACTAALAALITVLELRRQRVAAQKPELTPGQQMVYGVATSSKRKIPHFVWSEEKIDAPQDVEASKQPYCVRLFNLGTGPAKNVRAEWSFDSAALAEQINKLSQKSFANVYIDTSREDLVEVEVKDEWRAMYRLGPAMKGNYDHVFPSSVVKEGLLIPLPTIFQELTTIYYHLCFVAARSDSSSKVNFSDELLSVDLGLTYDDLTGKHYQSKFRLRVALYAYLHGKLDIDGSTQVPAGFTARLEYKFV